MINVLIQGNAAQLYVLKNRSPDWGNEHAHDTAYVEWVVRGDYRRCVDGGELRLSEGNAYLTGPDIEHSDHYLDEYESLCFELTRKEENDLLRRRGVRTHALTRTSASLIESSHVAAEILAPDDLSPLWLDTLVGDILLQTLRLDDTNRPNGVRSSLDIDSSNSAPRWVRSVYERVHEEAGMVTSLDDLARQAGVHPAHLSRVFTRVYGMPVVQFQRRQRLARAAQSLLSARPIVDVANDAGYQAQSQFSTAFRKAFGVSPGRYRLLHRP